MVSYDGLMAPVLGTSKSGPEPFHVKREAAEDDMDVKGIYYYISVLLILFIFVVVIVIVVCALLAISNSGYCSLL